MSSLLIMAEVLRRADENKNFESLVLRKLHPFFMTTYLGGLRVNSLMNVEDNRMSRKVQEMLELSNFSSVIDPVDILDCANSLEISHVMQLGIR